VLLGKAWKHRLMTLLHASCHQSVCVTCMQSVCVICMQDNKQTASQEAKCAAEQVVEGEAAHAAMCVVNVVTVCVRHAGKAAGRQHAKKPILLLGKSWKQKQLPPLHVLFH